jgi:16S rRNA (guanine1207-N2)-methyltransferase
MSAVEERCGDAAAPDRLPRSAVFGDPPHGLVDVPRGALQLSPTRPGSAALEALPDVSLSAAVVVAPPGTVERRYTLAHVMRAAAPGAPLTFLGPKDKGGARIASDLAAMGAEVAEQSRRHWRICTTRRPDVPRGLEGAMADGAPRLDPLLGSWTQPGLFSWDRIDAGSALLARHLPPLAGRGADFGCGAGFLARALLARSPAVRELLLIDLDRRATDCATKNIADPRVRVLWADVADVAVDGPGLDFVVTNPPFHDGGLEDRALGLSFIRRAAEVLSRGAVLWLVANRHLPYEGTLRDVFATVRPVVEEGGYKIYEAHR